MAGVMEKVTFNLRRDLKERMMSVKDELHTSMSAILQDALERYLAQKEREKLEKACELMALEYESDPELKEWSEFAGDYHEAV